MKDIDDRAILNEFVCELWNFNQDVDRYEAFLNESIASCQHLNERYGSAEFVPFPLDGLNQKKQLIEQYRLAKEQV